MFDIKKIRDQYPILKTTVNNCPLVYLDNAATTQKPKRVLDKIQEQYGISNANVHRSSHYLSNKATMEYEEARITMRKYIHASSVKEIIFTKGTTEGINLVASCFAEKFIQENDVIIVSEMEHHSNFVPWQQICHKKKAIMKIIPVDDMGELIFDEYINLLSERVKIVAITHVSNTLGTINPVKNIIIEAHKREIPVLLDGAQSIQHMKINVQELDCDFYCFSGHKMFGPTGIGVLYGKEKWLDKFSPYQYGGEMINEVSLNSSTFEELPLKFEAGTPNYVGAIALAEAVNYINDTGIKNIQVYENELLNYAHEKLSAVDGLKILGRAKQKTGVVSFYFNNIHSYDISLVLDKYGIAVRAGNHCTQPLMKRYGILGTVRTSIAHYNTEEDIDRLYKGLVSAVSFFVNRLHV